MIVTIVGVRDKTGGLCARSGRDCGVPVGVVIRVRKPGQDIGGIKLITRAVVVHTIAGFGGIGVHRTVAIVAIIAVGGHTTDLAAQVRAALNGKPPKAIAIAVGKTEL